MIHCNSVHQAARVVAIWTFPLERIASSSSSSVLTTSVPFLPGPVVTSHIPSPERNLVGGLATGERGMVRFQFVHEPGCLRIGTQVLLREGRTKCIGKGTRVVWKE